MANHPRKPSETKQPKLSPVVQMVVDLLTKAREHTMKSGFKVEGHQTVTQKGIPPVIVMYAAYPNGDYLCWFNDGLKFKMFALVNEKLREVMECAAGDLGKILTRVKELETKLGKDRDE